MKPNEESFYYTNQRRVEKLRFLLSRWINRTLWILILAAIALQIAQIPITHRNLVERKGVLEQRKYLTNSTYRGSSNDYYYTRDLATGELAILQSSRWLVRSYAGHVLYKNMRDVQPEKVYSFSLFGYSDVTKQEGGTFYFYLTKKVFERGFHGTTTPVFMAQTNDRIGSYDYWLCVIRYALTANLGVNIFLFSTFGLLVFFLCDPELKIWKGYFIFVISYIMFECIFFL